MRKYGFLVSIVIACGMAMLVSCQPKSGSSDQNSVQSDASSPVSSNVSNETTSETTRDKSSSELEQTATIEQVVDQFIVDTLGKQYAQAEVCIPQQIVVATDESNDQDIKVWGDFWVFNYSVASDTLKTASGGSHPGLIHLKKVDKGYEVTAFDQVGNGSQFEPTAKSIFGEKYDAFMKMHSNDKEREQNRAQGIAKYAKANDLKVTMYQDYGWPAVKLPE